MVIAAEVSLLDAPPAARDDEGARLALAKLHSGVQARRCGQHLWRSDRPGVFGEILVAGLFGKNG